ncbi:hypothetical protein SAMN04515679_4202 [Pelosinus fermentans]|uniref:Uncharacterized protein n=2 Tax=Sporomusaceae TaxID=1843490 RepID=I8RLN6_9FIRM|nr:hypothetical protein FB4_2743 [Pelosinus fermentans B4]EIW24707.1 hypothetical protein FA11_3098 [Pelosinus fermentans A11]OAM96013.1 hypothetical protein FR7_04035 [Pelosinus fermentans DSM 17108]SDR35364.1 hypothetical protein SAMN04515679_4202 [Pelosinus fermentans]
MMELLRKINWRVALVWGLLFVAMSNSFALAEEKLSPEKAYLSDVYKNMMDVNNLHYDVAIKAETPMGEVKIAVNGEGQEKPLNYQQDINISFRDVKNKENTVMLKQYIEQNQGNLVLYSLSNEKWIKQIVPLGFSLNKELSADEKVSARMDMLQLMKSVKLKKETPSYKYMEITLDSMQISDAIGAVVKLDNAQDKDMVRAFAVVRLGLLAAGDIKYNIKIDKATKMVKEIDMDLTAPIQKGAGLFLEIANPKDRVNIEDFLTKSTLNMQIKYSKYNQVDPIEIPQDVRDNAKEVKPADKAAPKKSEKILL